jgi:hypothetical protein
MKSPSVETASPSEPDSAPDPARSIIECRCARTPLVEYTLFAMPAPVRSSARGAPPSTPSWRVTMLTTPLRVSAVERGALRSAGLDVIDRLDVERRPSSEFATSMPSMYTLG